MISSAFDMLLIMVFTLAMNVYGIHYKLLEHFFSPTYGLWHNAGTFFLFYAFFTAKALVYKKWSAETDDVRKVTEAVLAGATTAGARAGAAAAEAEGAPDNANSNAPNVDAVNNVDPDQSNVTTTVAERNIPPVLAVGEANQMPSTPRNGMPVLYSNYNGAWFSPGH
jgi:hypothetical protein